MDIFHETPQLERLPEEVISSIFQQCTTRDLFSLYDLTMPDLIRKLASIEIARRVISPAPTLVIPYWCYFLDFDENRPRIVNRVRRRDEIPGDELLDESPDRRLRGNKITTESVPEWQATLFHNVLQATWRHQVHFLELQFGALSVDEFNRFGLQLLCQLPALSRFNCHMLPVNGHQLERFALATPDVGLILPSLNKALLRFQIGHFNNQQELLSNWFLNLAFIDFCPDLRDLNLEFCSRRNAEGRYAEILCTIRTGANGQPVLRSRIIANRPARSAQEIDQHGIIVATFEEEEEEEEEEG